MTFNGAHQSLRMRDGEGMEQEAIERGREQRGSAEPEGEQQNDGEVGCAVAACKQGPEDSRYAASKKMD